jgi:nucleoside-diphosphate-sugar epimerase
MQKKILISGANGFIGTHLCQYYLSKGYEVYGLVRQIPEVKIDAVHYQKFNLEEPDLALVKSDYEAFIHAAYIPHKKGSNSHNINKESSLKLYQECLAKQVQFVYLSSMSACHDALSAYGKSKYDIESNLDVSLCCIIRPGLVIGDGGLYKNMKAWISKSKIIPVFGDGRQVIQQIQVDDLCKIIQHITSNKINGIYTLAEPISIPMKEWYQTIAKDMNKKIRFLPIPYVIADILFFLIDLIPFELGVGKENYLGLKQMKERKRSTDFDDFIIP